MEDTGLNGYLKAKSYNREAISHVSSAFEKLSIPLPEEGEFYQTGDMGALVLLSPYACSLRITSSSLPTYAHPNILQPLIRFQGDDLNVELFPGVLTPFTSRDYSRWFGIFSTLEDRLADTGLKLTDINANNGGRLPVPYDEQYVLIDPGAIQRLANGVKYTESLLQETDPQTVLFGALKSLFCAAVKAQDGTLVKNAWKSCIRAKAQGTLVANWEHHDYCGTQKAAEKYSARLSLAPWCL